MSIEALTAAGEATGLTPAEKLVLFQLAYFHNAHTGQCNPSPERIAALTGLSSHQVRRAANALSKANHIAKSASGWVFTAVSALSAPANMPADWWPSETAIAAILEAHPDHDFDMEEAVRDFIAFCQRRNITIQPERRDAAFVRNITTILSHRRPGPAQIGRSDDRDQDRSIGALLAGLR